MRCPKCGQEVDTSLCAACPHCRTPMPTFGYQSEIGMRDSFGNTMTVGGNLNQQPKRKINRKVVIAVVIIVLIMIAACGIYAYVRINAPRTYEEKIKMTKEYAVKIVNQQLKYENLNDWYYIEHITDDGNNKFIIYCDVYGRLTTGSYGRIQTYVGIELTDNLGNYRAWGGKNIYPYGDNVEYYVLQLKNAMSWK